MTFKEAGVFIILFISIIAFTFWLIDRNIKSTKDCEDKGGCRSTFTLFKSGGA
jgi:hypothetical protein